MGCYGLGLRCTICMRNHSQAVCDGDRASTAQCRSRLSSHYTCPPPHFHCRSAPVFIYNGKSKKYQPVNYNQSKTGLINIILYVNYLFLTCNLIKDWQLACKVCTWRSDFSSVLEGVRTSWLNRSIPASLQQQTAVCAPNSI